MMVQVYTCQRYDENFNWENHIQSYGDVAMVVGSFINVKWFFLLLVPIYLLLQII